MKISQIAIRNFRRLEDVSIAIEEEDTVFVGPNNSGKTSATAVFRSFWSQRKFSIYDFSVSKTDKFSKFETDESEEDLPSIELDIWFNVDPDTIGFGRAFSLVPNLSGDFDELGVRLSYELIDSRKLKEAYRAAYPSDEEGGAQKSLIEFLSSDGNLGRHFHITYSALERTEDNLIVTSLDPLEGKPLIQTLVRIDFVDAQRNIDDDEKHRSNKLSSAFATFYKKNLERPETAAEAHKVIDENNDQLTQHYSKQFSGLMEVIQGLGIPSVNDRDLKIVSSLSPESALQGSTELFYVDTEKGHELPELYNGLGFKNLIFMAIQAKHFHSNWLQTEKNRPLCQIIFIEEPEVHLHAQVQQTFISNIWRVINSSAEADGHSELTPQIVVTTHSSHILDATEFAKVRHFQRCYLADENTETAKVKNATKVQNLSEFQPKAIEIEGQEASPDEVLRFLKRYLRLTHCDLFFADAAILVEGAVEKLLVPEMVNKAAPNLNRSFMTVLEVGGAYAHRFVELLSFLNLPYVIITDIDSVEATGRHPACRSDTPGALTSNATLKQIFDVVTIEQLKALSADQKIVEDQCTAFQTETQVDDNGHSLAMLGRTFEEAFAYDNFEFVRSGDIKLGAVIPENLDEAYGIIYDRVRSSGFKKTDFAMQLLAGDTDWIVPSYITHALKWLETRLHGETNNHIDE